SRHGVELTLPALYFADSDTGHFWVAVLHAGHVVLADGVGLLARDELGDGAAFPHALVGEHGRPGHVADGVVAGRGGLQAGIDLDEAPLGDLDAALRQADVFGVDRAARRHEHGGDLELARRAVGLDLDRHLVLGGRSLLHLGAGDHLDAALLVALRQRVRCFGVLERQDPRQRFDQRDAGPERAENVGELHADGPRADDRERGRRLLEEERLVRGNDGRLVDLQPDLRQALYARTRP